MSNVYYNFLNLILNISTFVTSGITSFFIGESSSESASENTTGGSGVWGDQTTTALDYLKLSLVPLLSIVTTAGIIYMIVLGVNMVKAESSDKRAEAKTRLINAIIGFVSLIVCMVILTLVINNIDEITVWLQDVFKGGEDVPRGAGSGGGGGGTNQNEVS